MPVPAFYPILDTEVAERCGVNAISAAEDILGAGARILQYRHKGFFSRAVFAELERVAELCRQAGALFVVNDRTDIALLAGAALHLGQDDLPPADARRLTGPGVIIGFSTHNEPQFRAATAQPVDYLAFGPIFGTATKQNPDPTVGLEELRRLRVLTAIPVVAIGGITRDNARAVIEAGADSVAIIGDLFGDARSIRSRAQEFLHLLPEGA
jgi:thiamine-phosphate pyrophosphorylase